MDGDHMKFNPIDDRYIYDVVSKNIKYFRLHNNSKYSSYGRMTQEQLAEHCDLSHRLISNIESTKVQQSFSLAVLYRIAKVLEVDIKEFFVERNFWFIVVFKIYHNCDILNIEWRIYDRNTTYQM